MSILTERVLKNEEARHGNVGRPSNGGRPREKRPRPGGQSNSVFSQSLTQDRHPLDRKFRCGFDPQNVTIKQYTAHLSKCFHEDCIGRQRRWPILLRQLGAQ